MVGAFSCTRVWSTPRILELKRLENYRRWGCQRLTVLLNREGWRVNRKRVQRLWKRLGLQVRPQQKRRRAFGVGENSCTSLTPEHPNHTWSYDFKYDATEEGSQLKFLLVLDEFTRRCLKIRLGRNCGSTDIMSTLAKLFRHQELPRFIRSDYDAEGVR